MITGKSTLVEVLGNYALGVEFSDPHRFQVKEEEGPTEKITSYTLFTRDKQRLLHPVTLIDTPGFQKGTLEEDKMLMQNIRDFIYRHHKHGVDAIVYTVQGSQVVSSFVASR